MSNVCTCVYTCVRLCAIYESIIKKLSCVGAARVTQCIPGRFDGALSDLNSFSLSRAFLLCNLSFARLLCKKRNYSGRWQQTVTMPTCVCEKGVSMAVSMLL